MLGRKLRVVGLLGIAGVLFLAPLLNLHRASLTRMQDGNPPVTGALTAPPQVEAILRRSCYDCHSNQTRWPWYSRIVLVSWLIARDVERGRKELNFSEWGSYYPVMQRRKLHWLARALGEEKMPPRSYRVLHPAARLTEADRVVLERWVEAELSHTLTDSPNR